MLTKEKLKDVKYVVASNTAHVTEFQIHRSSFITAQYMNSLFRDFSYFSLEVKIIISVSAIRIVNKKEERGKNNS